VNWKDLLLIAVVVLVVDAIVARVSTLRSIVWNE
jgi:hypothetical protein